MVCVWGVEPPTNFSKMGGFDRTPIFRGGLLGKRGLFFSGEGKGVGGGVQFLDKKYLTKEYLKNT